MSIVGGASHDNLLMQIVSDPERLRVEYTRLKDATDTARAVVATAGDVTQLQTLKQTAEASLTEAARVLAEAKAESAATIAAAQVRASTLLNEAEQYAVAKRSEADAVFAHARTELAEAHEVRNGADIARASMDAEYAEKVAAVLVREAAAAAAIVSAEKSKAALDQELARIRRIMLLTKEAAGG